MRTLSNMCECTPSWHATVCFLGRYIFDENSHTCPTRSRMKQSGLTLVTAYSIRTKQLYAF